LYCLYPFIAVDDLKPVLGCYGDKLDTERLGWSDGQYMGYSLRTGQYWYTIWMKDSFRSYKPFSKDLIVATELYDYEKDPNETVSVANDPKYAKISKGLHQQMIGFLESARNKK